VAASCRLSVVSDGVEQRVVAELAKLNRQQLGHGPATDAPSARITCRLCARALAITTPAGFDNPRCTPISHAAQIAAQTINVTNRDLFGN
jgi:hypothetical protein